jgi:hypothetical protein
VNEVANMMGVIAGLLIGVVVGLFLPPGVALVAVVGLIIIIALPQFSMAKVPALVGLLTAVLIVVAKIYMAGHIIAGA